MPINAYIHFNGQCEAAFRFYERALNGKIELLTFGNSPMASRVGAEWRDKIMHVRLVAGDNVLMGCDAPPDQYQKPQGFRVAITVKKPEDAERIFSALAENGTVQMPLQETFWSPRFGMLADQFGIPWMVNCDAATQNVQTK